MDTITPRLLIRQRNFFLSAIALTVVPMLVIEILTYAYYFNCFKIDVEPAWKTPTEIIFSLLGPMITFTLIGYGFYMGIKGYLKKYVAYIFVNYALYYIVVKLIFPYVPAVNQIYESFNSFEKQLCAASNFIVAGIVVIISVKGSVMGRWMKWLFGLGYFLGLPLIDCSLPFMLFTDEEIAADPVMRLRLPADIVNFAGYILAAVIIMFYYNRRIKKETLQQTL